MARLIGKAGNFTIGAHNNCFDCASVRAVSSQPVDESTSYGDTAFSQHSGSGAVTIRGTATGFVNQTTTHGLAVVSLAATGATATLTFGSNCLIGGTGTSGVVIVESIEISSERNRYVTASINFVNASAMVESWATS